MSETSATDAAAVQTRLNYMGEMSEPPASYAYAPPPGKPQTNMKVARETVVVRDARAMAVRPSLEREGFELIERPSAVKDFYDDDEVRRSYYPECERLLREAAGAARAVAFDHITRCAARSLPGENAIKGPARGVHNDYTARSGPQRVRDLMGDEAAPLLRHRCAIINVWRPIGALVEESPLGVCDARTVAPGDLVSHARIYPDRHGEIQAVRFNPAHRWYYFSRMRPEEALLLKCYDSAEDGRARFTPHTAFDDPASPPGARPRESIEVRLLAFFAEG